jgi:membrane associated rhomboid family serine protease
MRGFLRIEFWRLIGFQFLHAHEVVAHIIFNMIGLFVFGPIVEERLGRKRYLAFYLLCGIFGALAYVLLNLCGLIASEYFGIESIPGLLFNDPYQPLIGASAGVYGVIVAGAHIVPNERIYVMGILPVKIATFAFVLVVTAFLTLLMGAANAGGEAGHIGGALAGWYFIRNTHHLHGFFDVLGRVDPTSHHYRGEKPVRPVKARQDSGATAEVDRILDKIKEHSIASLTEREKRTLEEASRQGRR